MLRVIFLFLVVWPGSASACEVPQPLLTLVRTLSAMMGQGGAIAGRQADRLSSDLAAVSETAVLREMAETGLAQVSGTALDIMAEAQRISDSGAMHNPELLRRLLNDLVRDSRRICDAAPTVASPQDRPGGVFRDGDVDWEELDRKLQEDKALTFGSLMAALVAMIGGLFAMDSLFRWIMALVYNRKACRIPANLHVAGSDIPGLLVTLGKGGCRFHPDDPSGLDAVRADLRDADCVIAVTERDFPVQVSAIHDLQCDFRFDRPMSIRCQRSLLAQSTMSPFYIRKNRDGGTAQTETIV